MVNGAWAQKSLCLFIVLFPPCIPEQRTTPQGQVYFIHRATGMSTWHDPRFRDMSIDSEELGNLGEGWEIRYTAHGRQYFVDHINRTTQFTGVYVCLCVYRCVFVCME